MTKVLFLFYSIKHKIHHIYISGVINVIIKHCSSSLTGMQMSRLDTQIHIQKVP